MVPASCEPGAADQGTMFQCSSGVLQLVDDFLV